MSGSTVLFGKKGLKKVTLTSNTTWIVPAGVDNIIVTMVAGGGAGFQGSGAGGGGGGGGGGVIQAELNVVPAESIAITVGQGGATSGANGGNTTLVSLLNNMYCSGGTGAVGITAGVGGYGLVTGGNGSNGNSNSDTADGSRTVYNPGGAGNPNALGIGLESGGSGGASLGPGGKGHWVYPVTSLSTLGSLGSGGGGAGATGLFRAGGNGVVYIYYKSEF